MKQQTTLVKLITLFLTLTFAAAYTQLPNLPSTYTSNPLGATTRAKLQNQYELDHNGKHYTMLYPQKMQNTRAKSPVSKSQAGQKTMMLELMDSNCQQLAWNQQGVTSIGQPHPKNRTARIDSGNACSGAWRAMEFQIGGRDTYAKLVFDGDAELFLKAGFGCELQAYFEEGMQLSANNADIYHVKVTSVTHNIDPKQLQQQQALAYQQAQAAAADAAKRNALQAFLDAEAARAEAAAAQFAALSPRSDTSDLSVDSTVSTCSTISGKVQNQAGNLVDQGIASGVRGTVKKVAPQGALINFIAANGRQLLVQVPASQFIHLKPEMQG